MNKLKVFTSKEFGEVRTVCIDGEPWFVGKDVAEILGYSNTRKALADHVDKEDKTDGVTIRDSIGREQNPVCINESGLYSLILSSKLPNAKKFKHWVTSEVLTSIRRHGMYAVDELVNDPDLLIQVATELKLERQKRKAVEEEREHLQQELDVSKDWYSIKRVAAMNGVKWKTFNWRLLKDKSLELGYGVKKIFDANYGEVNTYHKVVWEEVYPEYEI